jgi:hypothetical protein
MISQVGTSLDTARLLAKAKQAEQRLARGVSNIVYASVSAPPRAEQASSVAAGSQAPVPIEDFGDDGGKGVGPEDGGGIVIA